MEGHFLCTRLNHSWKRIPRSQDVGNFFHGTRLVLHPRALWRNRICRLSYGKTCTVNNGVTT